MPKQSSIRLWGRLLAAVPKAPRLLAAAARRAASADMDSSWSAVYLPAVAQQQGRLRKCCNRILLFSAVMFSGYVVIACSATTRVLLLAMLKVKSPASSYTRTFLHGPTLRVLGQRARLA